MKLGDLLDFKIGNEDADFWIAPFGNEKTVGKPSKKFDENYIGVKVKDYSVLDPGYAYYVFEYLSSSGLLAQLSDRTNTGVMRVRISDIKEIPIGQS
jgi:hypothetical protein